MAKCQPNTMHINKFLFHVVFYSSQNLSDLRGQALKQRTVNLPQCEVRVEKNLVLHKMFSWTSLSTLEVISFHLRESIKGVVLN